MSKRKGLALGSQRKQPNKREIMPPGLESTINVNAVRKGRKGRRRG